VKFATIAVRGRIPIEGWYIPSFLPSCKRYSFEKCAHQRPIFSHSRWTNSGSGDTCDERTCEKM